MRRITTIGAAGALVGLLAGPAFADCVQQIVQVKSMADQASDPAKREMAVQHLGMAQAKIVDVQGSSMPGTAMQGEGMMSEDQGTAMKGEAMQGETMSADQGMAMKDEAMSGDQGMAMGDQSMAMMEDECMAEVMKAQQALQ